VGNQRTEEFDIREGEKPQLKKPQERKGGTKDTSYEGMKESGAAGESLSKRGAKKKGKEFWGGRKEPKKVGLRGGGRTLERKNGKNLKKRQEERGKIVKEKGTCDGQGDKHVSGLPKKNRDSKWRSVEEKGQG